MDYLQIREDYLVSYHRWLNFNQRLMDLFDVVGDAALETAMLKARSEKRHLELLSEYSRLGHEFDAAGDKWDAAQAAVAAQVNKDFSLIEC